MGNEDGFVSAMSNVGTNTKTVFTGGYFSFAFGNEIALVLEKKEGYFILNCDNALWNKVKSKVKEVKSVDKLIEWWIKESKNYEISDWSADFKELKGENDV